MIKTDAIDRAIIEFLSQNGRTSNKEIANRLEVSEGTIRNRISRLIDENYLTVRGLIDPDKNPDYQLVFLGAKLAVGKNLRKAAKDIEDLPYVRSVTIVSGRYDLFIEAFLPNHELINFISDHLTEDGSVTDTESFIAMASEGKWV